MGNGRGIRSVRLAGTGGLRLQLLGPIEGEIAVRQGIHEGAVADSLKLSVVAISICKDHPRIDTDVARLHAVGDPRPIGRAA